MTVSSFWKIAAENPEWIALVDVDGTEVTAGELLAGANQLVHGLREKGLQENDVVALLLPNTGAFLEILMATMQAAWHIVVINNSLTAEEIAYILQDSGARAFFSHEQFADKSTRVMSALEAQVSQETLHADLACFAIGKVPGFIDFASLKEGRVSTLPDKRIAGQFMQYTSGTTGRPKGVLREIFPIDADTMVGFLAGNLSRFDIEPEQNNVHLCTSPMYHTAPLAYSYFSLHFGHKVVLMAKWDAEEALSLIEKHRVTTTHMVPTQFHRLLQLPENVRQKYDVSSLKQVIHAAAPCPIETKRQLMAWWGEVIYEYYGATEGGGAIAKPADWLAFPGTVGKAWEGGELRIYDDQKKLLGANETGTVYMKLQQDFNYKGDDNKTREGRIGEFFTVGDVGYLNEQGYLFLCDRKIDMIIAGGVNIYPAEIESILFAHPAVGDVAVFGVPNSEWGEEVKAVVEPRAGFEAKAHLKEDILAFCHQKLAKYKVPRSIDFIEKMPRDANGKLYKRKLREVYWQEVGSAI